MSDGQKPEDQRRHGLKCSGDLNGKNRQIPAGDILPPASDCLICLERRQWRFWPWHHVRNSSWRAFSGQQSHRSESGKDSLQACRPESLWRLESVLLSLHSPHLLTMAKLQSHLHRLGRFSSQRSPWSRLRDRKKHRGTI